MRISTQVLDARGIKWLNDPFDTSLIDLYDVSDEELMRLVGKIKISETSSSHRRTRSSRPSSTEERYKLEMEEMKKKTEEAKKEKEQMSVSEMLRMEEELKEKLYVAEQQSVRRGKSPLPQQSFRSDQELVNFILDGWELSSSSPDNQLKVPRSGNQQKSKSTSPRWSSAVENTSPCGYVFRKGEPMYHCHDCCFRDQVFCAECFDLRVHADHLTETNPAMNNRSYCDCSPNETVRRDMICSMHKTKMLGSSTVNR